MSATDVDGSNTGTARLGTPVYLTATVSPGQYNVVNWSAVGGGSFTTTGNTTATYTPPKQVAAGSTVTVTGYLHSAPSVTTSLTFTLLNPIPVVTAASPTQLTTGSTQTVSLTGSGFLSGMVVMMNGNALTTYVTSSTSGTVKVPVPATATGNISLQVVNPAPGGGAGTVFTETLPAGALSLVATDQDGTNTGTAELGINVAMSAIFNGSATTAVNWSLTGAGNITSTGLYTSPATMPASNVVTITASLASNPAVSASYQLGIINPLPVLSSANVTHLLPGNTASVLLSGSGFQPNTTIQASAGSVTTTYQSATSILAQVTLPANATGTVSFQAQTASPGGGVSAMLQLPVWAVQISANDADGLNTGTAELGINVNMAVLVNGTAQSGVAWSATGAGSISAAGVYTAPATMPANNVVTITGMLTSPPTATVSYQLNIINPVPTLTSPSPATVIAGASNTITLTGNNFVPGTILQTSAGTVTATYQSPTSMVAQLNLPASATGSVTLQAQNPSPGGGSSATTLPLPVYLFQLSASDQDGTNTGTAELGINVTMSALLNGVSQSGVTWSVAGGGSITSAGVYTAPPTMPASSAVTITATLSSNPSATATYALGLLYPVPTLTSANLPLVAAGTTATVMLTGTNLVPTTTIQSTIGTVTSTTYQSATSIQVQLTLPANATGNVSLSAQNPTPGGGTSAGLQIPIGSMQLTATDADGTNTGTAELGITVNMSAAVGGAAQSGVTWSVTGAGSISTNGTYTAPATMPTNPAVTITAALTSNPTLTATYMLNLIYPVPALTSASVSLVAAGTSESIILTGSNFNANTTIQATNGTVTSTTYQSATSISVQVTLPANATGNLSLTAQNPSPGGGASAALPIPIGSMQLTATDADGTNTGTAELNISVTMGASVPGSPQAAVTWSLVGSGTISSSGVYKSPSTLPANPSVTITATLTANPSITASYQLTILGKSPTLTSASVEQVAPGVTVPVMLTGTNFVSGSTVLVNTGTVVSTTYQSATSITAQIQLPANASGNLSVQVQNPGTGGGTSAALQIPIGSMLLTASDADGTNTGTAELGVQVTLTATVGGAVQSKVNWSATGGGSISTKGVYTAPTAMPANSVVTITAALTSNTTVTSSYQLTLINPVPTITRSSPSNTVSGGAISLTLTGTGFVPGTVITSSLGTVTATTYQSATSMTALVTLPVGATGNVNLQAQNPTPSAGTGTALQLPVWSLALTASDVDGNNTGTGRLGLPVTLTPTINAGSYAAVTYSLQGAGTLATHNGVETYTPPQTMPSSTSVVITAYMSSYTQVTTSYSLSLLNPVPAVASAAPTQLLTAGTQPVVLTGSGFVPGTTVMLNGSSLATTLTSYTQMTAQVPVSGSASGTLNLQVVNPAPGGGAGSVVQETVATPTITLSAKDADGVNTGTAELGVSVTVTPTVTGSTQTGVTWSVVGPGSISSGGVYTAPATMPANGGVTITAALTSNPNITASYQLNVINPAPVISSMNPAQVPAGTTTTVTLTGTGFIPSTALLASAGTVTWTYQSSTSMVATVTMPATATGTLSLQAQNASPGGGTSAASQLPIWYIQLSASNADGNNTGTARLGLPVNLTATPSAGNYQAMTWTLQGGGKLNTTGSNTAYTYTPPQTMPASTTAIITVTMSSYPTVSTTYTIALGNPIPVVTSATPTQLQAGGTQTVTLAGSGFVPGGFVSMNGSSLPISYTSYTAATVQVPVPGTAAGTINLQMSNPTPGGGAGSMFSESVTPNSISVTAVDADGTNTGSAELGVNVTLTASVSGSLAPAVTWSLVGPGSLSGSGVYTAPASMPSNNAVTITATLVSNPAVSASYQLNVINAVPQITAASPYEIPNGATTTVTLTGSGFVPGTAVTSSLGSITTTYQSATSIVAKITLPAQMTGNFTLQAENPAPGGGTGVFFEESIVSPISATAAARLLDQTTFGPTLSLIQHVQQEGITGWLTEQFNTPMTVMAPVPVPEPATCPNQAPDCANSEWWQTVLTGNDQLRQRVAFALSQLFVVSADTISGYGVTPYANMLASDAFGNWYNIMKDVTLSPAMGVYLNMLDSAAATGTNQIANENFARENMQLFNLGMTLLNPDGSPQLDGNGNPIPTYTEAQIQQFAKVYTGWTYANPDGSTPNYFNSPANYGHPMVAVESYHDETAKTLLNGTVLPAGQTAEQDLAGALTNIFNHPNVPPFVCRQLIQHLVTSNPSPAYLGRVASVFANDGNGVRGDMQAVLTAIFTDPEARAGDTAMGANDGHLREPALWFTSTMRGLGYTNVDPNNFYNNLSTYSGNLAEFPFASPSVFNFFPAEYAIPGTMLNGMAGTTLNGPEFGQENTGSTIVRLTFADRLVNNKITEFNVDLSATSPLGQLASNPASLVDALGEIFLYSEMDPSTRAAIISEISTIPTAAQQVRVAAYLVISSSPYKIIH